MSSHPRISALVAVAVGAAIASRSATIAQDLRPSFNCDRATFADERAICTDDRLAEMDQAESIALGMIKGDDIKSAREDALSWLKGRHACAGNKVCILDNQAQVIDLLNGYGAHVSAPPWVGSYRLSLLERADTKFVTGLPTRVGACTRTMIARITTRFGETLKPPEDPTTDAGTSVDYANEGRQVSYSYQESVGASAIGDDIVLCLVSLPKDCPPGDDRGKIYSATNIRTSGSWILPDSQHMCGGA